LSRGGMVGDAGIEHYRAKHIRIVSNPQMPIMADGNLLGQGTLSIHVHPRALTVMAGSALTGQRDTSRLTDSKDAVNG